MFSKCSGYAPQFRKMERPMPSMPDVIMPNSPINPIMPVPTAPAVPAVPYDPPAPAAPTAPTVPAAPNQRNESSQTGGNSPNYDNTTESINQPARVNPTVPMTPGNPLMPEVIPEAPLFSVPSNPLLPPEYQEVLSYDSLQYLNGFLRTQIGRNCDVQFLIGSNSTEMRTGTLIGVGLNYILLQDLATREVIACDFYSIKFVDFHN